MAVEAEDMAARLLAEFRYALENGQLVAYFQPEVELSSGRVVAAESLVRWEHPHLGTLPPSLFAPLAERPMSAEVFAGWLRNQDQATPRRGGAGHRIAASAMEAAVAAADRLQAGGRVSRRLARPVGS